MKIKHNYPSQRNHHSVVFYKNKFHVWGGCEINNQYPKPYIYVYDFESKLWKRNETKGNYK